MKKIWSFFLITCIGMGLFAFPVYGAQKPTTVTVSAVTKTSDHPDFPSELSFIDASTTAKWMFNESKGFAYNNSSQTGMSMEFTFEGTGVELIGCTDKNTGNIDVYLDGAAAPGSENGKVTIVRSSSMEMNKTLYRADGLENKEHILKVTVRGDYSGSNNYFELQRICYTAVYSEKEQLEDMISKLSWNDIKGKNQSNKDIQYDLKLDLALEDDIQVKWTAQPEGYVDTDTGAILKFPQKNQSQDILLTAELYIGDHKAQKSFFITLQGKSGIIVGKETGFYKKDGTPAAALTEAGQLCFKAGLINQEQKAQEVRVIIASYDEQGVLLGCTLRPASLPAEEKAQVVCELPSEPGDRLCAYIWEDASQKPLEYVFRMKRGGAEIYVSPQGNDHNDGSREYPFYSAERATMAAKDIIKDNPDENITVLLESGTYRLQQPLEWNADTSPSDTGSVTYRTYGQEPAVFSGAADLGRLAWEPYQGNIVKAEIGIGYDFDVLYVNSQRQIMARYPNFTNPDTIFGYTGNASDVLSASRIQNKWKRVPQDGYVRALHSSKWGGNSFKITDVSSDGTVSLEWVGDNNRGSGYDSKQMVVENVLEELDAPQEWYYDKQEGILYYYPESGTDLASARFEGACTSELVRVVGESEQRPVQNISFENIHFTKTHRALFTAPYERPLRGDWGISRTGTVFMENARSVAVVNCRFDETGGNAVMMSGYNTEHVIDQNQMTQIGASAVLIVGKEEAVRDPSHWDDSDHKTVISDTAAGPKSGDYARDITISNNYMYDLGLYEKQVSGVCMSIAARIHVKGNTIHRCPRAGINISDGTFGGHLIEYNDIFDCVRGTSDHGPINSWGRDRFWSLGGYNTNGKDGAKKAPYALLDAIETNIIRYNRISHNGAYGVDLDDGSSNYEIYSNLFLGTGVKLREGFHRTVRNNIIVNNVVNIHVSYEGNQDKVENNVIISNKPYVFISPNTGSKTTFDKNLFYYGKEAITVDANGLSSDQSYMIADPLFTNPQKNDYTLKVGSPALNAGFENFDMEHFGVKGAPEPPPQELNFEVKDDSDEENFLGGRISSIYSESILSATGLPDTNGVYIINPLLVAYEGGEALQKNDVIRTLNGVQVKNKNDFLEQYEKIKEGETVVVAVYRNQKNYEKMIQWKKS